MSFTHTITTVYTADAAQVVNASVNYTDDVEAGYDDAVPTATVNEAVAINFVKNNLQSCLLYSDQAITIKTNSGSAPTDTITLAAKTPLVWGIGNTVVCPFSADVTAGLFISNSSGLTANVHLRFLVHL